ncbi:MAG: 3-deoxy-manno-octulosonate cytidylyltransferase [Myxococcota bacterium]
MRSAIIIPARLGATRLPRKPLATLGGLPLIVRVMQQARKCRAVDDVVVATDSEEIAAAVERHGGRAVMTSPSHPSGSDRVAEAATRLAVDLVINLQGDEPFVVPSDLERMLKPLAEGRCDIVTLRAPIVTREELVDPSAVKVVCRDDGMALYFSRATIPYERAQTGDIAGTYRHIGVYGYRRAALERLVQSPVHPLETREGLEQLRALALGQRILVLDGETQTRGIDTPLDLAAAEQRVHTLGEAAFPGSPS